MELHLVQRRKRIKQRETPPGMLLCFRAKKMKIIHQSLASRTFSLASMLSLHA